MKVKDIKREYPFHHIFVNGNELYHKDNSLDSKEVKTIEEKEHFFGSKSIHVSI